MEKLATGKKRRKLKAYIPLFVLTMPGVIYLIINNYMPMFGVIIAFKKIDFHKGILGSDWVGFKNFEYLFKTSDAFVITRNTILYNLAFIILGIIVQVTFAILLNEMKTKLFMRLYQSLIVLPSLISMIIVAYLLYALLSTDTGLVNKTLLPLFGADEPIPWYSTAKYWPFILIIVQIWKTAGFGCIIYLASIVGISPEYYEAAKLDGATKWQQIKSITLPLLQPVIIMLALLSIGRIFYSDFGLFYQVPMNVGVLYSATNTIDTYVYRAMFKLGDIGMASAAGVYQSVVGFVLIIISNFIVKKISSENALF